LRESSAARGSARSLVFRLLQGATDFLTVLVTARGFGDDGRGIYALASFAAAFSVIPVGAISVPLVAEWAHRRAELGRLYATSLVLAFVGGGIAAFTLAGLAVLRWPEWRLLLFAAAAVPFLALAIYQQELYRALGDIRRMSYIYLGVSLSSLAALSAVAAVAPGQIYLALAAWAGAQVIVPLATLHVQRSATRFVWRGAGSLAARLFRRSFGISLGTAIARLAHRVDLLVVAALLSLSDVGRYSVALAVSESLWQLSRAVITGAYSRIVNSSGTDSIDMTIRTVRHSLLLLTTGGLLAVGGTKLLLEPLLGDSFDGIWLPLAALLPGIVALGAAEVLQPFILIRLERSREYLTTYATSLTLNLALAFALVPPFGLLGAALATSLAYTAGAFYLFSRFWQLAGSRRLSEWLPRRSDLADYRRLFHSLYPRSRGELS
jgi:O-antigen/teichoic acid export membrane protein